MITLNKLLSNLETQHIQRKKAPLEDPKDSYQAQWLLGGEYDEMETRLKYKGATIATVYTKIVPVYSGGYYTPKKERIIKSHYITIDVETNARFIKKHKLPFRKTRVTNQEFSHNSTQLSLGTPYVRKLLKEIVLKIEELWGIKPKEMRSNRCNGIYANSKIKSSKDSIKNRNCRINLERMY